MTTKLTLTIDDNIILAAKKYARQKGKSLSGMVETYLKLVVEKEESTEVFSPKIARLKGVIKLPEDFDYKKEIGKAVTAKYRQP